MKDIIKNLGLIFIVIGVIILSIAVFRETQTNAKLAISLVLIVGGLIGHILLSKYME
jgi:uncharacterized protein YjeT (DUF2065 family)